ncbi:MAG: HD domain-containing protein [Acetatifactor sp.]|nr:HD domain-containing protein [Acetatifactor sp.]
MTEEKMIREIQKCTETIIRNLAEEAEWNNKMLEAEERTSFAEVMKSRSEAIRAYYKENEECIAVLKKYAEGPFTHEIAMELYESIRSMQLNGRMDPGLMYELSAPIMQYMRSRDDMTEQAIIISMIHVACSVDYYNRMVGDMNIDELMEILRFIISHKDQYCSFEKAAARFNILYAYEALIALGSGDEVEEVCRMVMEWLREVNELLDNPEVQALDGAEPEFAVLMYNTHFLHPLEQIFYANDYPDLAKIAVEMCKKECAAYAESDNWAEKCIYDLVELGAGQVEHTITDVEVYEKLLAMLKFIPNPKWDEEPSHGQIILQVYMIVYTKLMEVVRKRDIPAEEKDSIVSEAWKDAQRVFADIPYQYQTSYINGLFKNLLSYMLPNITNTAFVEQLIDELLIRRQPATYFHSYMVESIAKSIAEKMLENRPELFLTLPSFDSVETVKDRKEEILDTICRGARLHDIGKCAIASVIMLQSRRLLEDEFFCIKYHPKLGEQYLENYDAYEVCRHIIFGHHKFYDGTKGYPAEFDNTASPYRLYIDLISISDAIDAATDILGRNYANGKDFEHLLKELQTGAGTRYNPDIVSVITASPELIEELTVLTGRDRMQHCYEIYRQVVKRQK